MTTVDETAGRPDDCAHRDLLAVMADTGQRKCYDCGVMVAPTTAAGIPRAFVVHPGPMTTAPVDGERCCVCGSPDIGYRNYREKPFCWPCADGKGPHDVRPAAVADQAGNGFVGIIPTTPMPDPAPAPALTIETLNAALETLRAGPPKRIADQAGEDVYRAVAAKTISPVWWSPLTPNARAAAIEQAAQSPELRRITDAARAPLLAEVERLTRSEADLRAKLEAVDVLAPANAHLRKLRDDLDQQRTAHMTALSLEAIEQRQRAEKAEGERDEALTDGRRMWAELREARADRVQAVLALVVGYAWRDPKTGAELVLAPEDVRLIVRDDGSGSDA
jgi:hypothetical protein